MKHGARSITGDIATVTSLVAIFNTSITEIHSPKSSITSCIVDHVGTRLPVINAWYHTAPAGIRLFEHASLSILPRCAVSPGTASAPMTSSFPLRAPTQLHNNVFYTGPPSEKRRGLTSPGADDGPDIDELLAKGAQQELGVGDEVQIWLGSTLSAKVSLGLYILTVALA